MKFAHMADCHIGSWRDPKLKDISLMAFYKAIDICKEEQVDFILISGDLFNTSLPNIGALKLAAEKFKQVKDMGIGVYIIPGSHDFSPSGKTMLDVLERAGLFINVVKGDVVDDQLQLRFTTDPKTGAKITGMLGKRGMLEKKHYEKLIRKNLEQEPGYKIFMFHSALQEFKPKDLENVDVYSVSLLPRNFDYYAGGHVHYVFQKTVDSYGTIAYPGPLFPNSFKELEDLKHGGLYIVEDGNVRWRPIALYNVHSIRLDCTNMNPRQVESALMQNVEGHTFANTIVTVRLSGTLGEGKPTEIDFKKISDLMYEKKAYFVMRNTTKLLTKDFEEIKIEKKSVEQVEEDLIREHVGQVKLGSLDPPQEHELTKKMMHLLSREKNEGERVMDFEDRISEEIHQILESMVKN